LLAKYENGDAIVPNLHYMPNGKVIEVQGVRIEFLGGNFSSRWFNQPIPNKCQSQKILAYLRKYAEGTVGRTKCIALGAVNYQGQSDYQLSI